MGSNGVHRADLSEIKQGDRCLLWPDNDKSGRRWLLDLTKRLLDQGAIVEIIDVFRDESLPESFDIADALEEGWSVERIINWAKGLEIDSKDVKKFIEEKEQLTKGQDKTAVSETVILDKDFPVQPQLLHAPIESPKEFPFKELGPILGPAAKVAYHYSGAQSGNVGLTILSAASFVVQSFVNIRIDSRSLPLTIFCFVVAPSGERKSSSLNALFEQINKKEREIKTAYLEKMDKHSNLMSVYSSKYETLKADFKKKLRNKTLKEGAESAYLKSLEELKKTKPNQPLNWTMFYASTSFPALFDAIEKRPSIMWRTDEFGVATKSHAFNSDNILQTVGSLSTVWDGGSLDSNTRQHGHKKIYDRRLGLFFMGQPKVVGKFLEDETLRDQGFLNRCLLASSIPRAGWRKRIKDKSKSTPEIKDYDRQIKYLLDKELPLKDKNRELNIKEIELSEDAEKIHNSYYDKIEFEEMRKDANSEIKTYLNRAVEHALRIAGVIEVFHNPNFPENIEKVTISKESMDHGTKLADYFISVFHLLTNLSQKELECEDAEILLNYFYAKKIKYPWVTDILTNGPNRSEKEQKKSDRYYETPRRTMVG